MRIELFAKYGDGASEVDIHIVDKRGVDYDESAAKPAATFTAFAGVGNTLRSESVPSSDRLVFSADTLRGVTSLTVDESRPTTLIQVKMPDGSKKRIK